MVYFEVKKYSRLGNWMFQYAAAKSLGQPVGCVIESPDLLKPIREVEWFKGLEIRLSPPDNITIFKQPSFRACKMPTPTAGKDILLSGYFQSAKFIRREIALECFSMSEAKRNELYARYGDTLNRPEITAIHIRRGDYLRNPTRHPFVGRKYLKDAIAYMRKLKGTHDFLVLSDDMDWCHRFFVKYRFPGLTFYYSENKFALDDMYLASLCRNNIISNSSFGWWGAWLNENDKKVVVAPSAWFGEDLRAEGVDWSDIYTEEMVVVDNELRYCRRVGAYCIKLYWICVAKVLKLLKKVSIVG